jgi:hypothetical protein
MATRKKTITVPVNFGNVADLVNNTLTTIGTPTIYIPENSVSNPVTFSSVCFFSAAQDTSTLTGATITTYTNTLTLAGAPASSVTITGSLANTGENWGGLFGPVDYTTYFNTNYGTVNSKVLTVQVLSNITTGTGTTTRGVYGYLEITYTYSDTEPTRIKTVCIPYESGTGTLTAVANTTFCTLPNLTGGTGWLDGYSGLVIRDRWIEIKGNCNNNNTATDSNLTINFDSSGSPLALPVRESALGSDSYQIYLVDASALTTTSTHLFQLWNSIVTRWSNIIVNEWINFEYDVSGSTRVLNYIEIPVDFDSPVPGTTSAVALRLARPLLISEPGSLVMRKCSIEIDYNTGASATVAIKGGVQASYRSYAQISNIVAGMFSFQHGLDASSASGSAFTLVRGENDIIIDLYRSAGSAFNVSGVIKILYESDVASGGVDNNSDVRRGFMRQLSFTATGDVSVTDSFQIPDSNYWIQGLALQNYFWMSAAVSALTQQASILPGESDGAGWRELFADTYVGDNEIGYGLWTVRARPEFKIYPQSPNTERLNVESSRSYRTTSTTTFRFGTTWVVSYNTIEFSISGNVSGSNGGLVTLSLFRADNEDLVAVTTRVGNGAYSFVAYDDTISYFITAYEDNTYKGLSKSDLPGSDFDINLSSSGAVTTGYAGG